MLNFPAQTPVQVLNDFLPVFNRTYSDPILRDLYRQYVHKNNLDTLQSKISMLHDLEIYAECEYSLRIQNSKTDPKAKESNDSQFAYLNDMIKLLSAEHKAASQSQPPTLSANMVNLLLKLLTETMLRRDNLYNFDLSVQAYTKELMKDCASHTHLVLKIENMRKQYKNEVGFEYAKQSFLRDYHRALAGDYFSCPIKRATLNKLPKQNQPELELKLMCQIGDTRYHKATSRPLNLSSSVLREHEYVKQVIDCVLRAVENSHNVQTPDYKLMQSFLVDHLKKGRGLSGSHLKQFDVRVKALIQEISAPYWFAPGIATELKGIRLGYKAAVQESEQNESSYRAKHKILNQHLENKSNKAVIKAKLKALIDNTKTESQMHSRYTIDITRLKEISDLSMNRFFHFKTTLKPIEASDHLDKLYYKDKTKSEKTICEIIEKRKTLEPYKICPPDATKILSFSHKHKELVLSEEPQDPIEEFVSGIKNFFRKLTK